MEENDIKKLRKIPGFGDLKSFRFLVEKMYTELEAQPEKEKKMVALLLGESLHELDVLGKHAFSATHPIDFSVVYNTYEHLYTIVQKYHYLLMLSNDSTLSALRNRGKKLGNLSDLKEKLVSALADVAMLSLDEGGSKKKKIDQMIETQKRLNELRNVIFSYITSSPMWDEDEAKEYQELLHSRAVDSVTAQLMVSAITLSCLYFFDRKKFNFLFKRPQKAHLLHELMHAAEPVVIGGGIVLIGIIAPEAVIAAAEKMQLRGNFPFAKFTVNQRGGHRRKKVDAAVKHAHGRSFLVELKAAVELCVNSITAAHIGSADAIVDSISDSGRNRPVDVAWHFFIEIVDRFILRIYFILPGTGIKIS